MRKFCSSAQNSTFHRKLVHTDYMLMIACEYHRHDIEKVTNEIVNKTTNDLRQLSTLTTQTPDNRVSEWPNYRGENRYPTYFDWCLFCFSFL